MTRTAIGPGRPTVTPGPRAASVDLDLSGSLCVQRPAKNDLRLDCRPLPCFQACTSV